LRYLLVLDSPKSLAQTELNNFQVFYFELLMSLALWRSPIARALHHNSKLVYGRYLQLATIRLNGRPANRTVVFRGFLDDTNDLKFITDIRSEKIESIKQQPWAEVCWYFPNSREQFRISGCLKLVDSHDESALQQARIATWQALSDEARLQFSWPHPGKPRVDDKAAFNLPAPNPHHPVTNFCLLLLNPLEVDHLKLRGEPQNRCLYSYDEQQGWSMQEINP
jgi:pyridoxamine 5'-phosphate oxidase